MRPTAYRRNARCPRDRQAFEQIRMQAGALFAAGHAQVEATMLPELVRRARPAVLVVARKEQQMTTAPKTYGSGTVMPVEAIHVTGRRVVATLIDGLVFGVAYWLLALAFGDVRTEGEAANWVSNLPVWTSVAYGLFVIGYYVLLEGYLGRTVGKMATGIKVVSEATGATPGIAAAAIRTLLRLIDGLFSYAVVFITALASSKRQRLGDMAAHTLVVRA